MTQGNACALRSTASASPHAGSAATVRWFRGPWPVAHARMQLFLLEMLAARPRPRAVHIHLARSLLTPAEVRRDVTALRDALACRLGAARVRCEVMEDADGHMLRLEWADAPACD